MSEGAPRFRKQQDQSSLIASTVSLTHSTKQPMLHSERFLKIVEETKERVVEITPEKTLEMQQRGEPFLLIDTREDKEWEAGHIAGAIHVGKGVIERDIEKTVPDNETPIVLYCGGGFRSALAADALQRMGYMNVRSMSEGWRGWNDRGYPVE